MLTIVVPGVEMFDEGSQEFVSVDDVTLELEHSLISLSKWESKHEKPFLSTIDKTLEEIMDYIEAMILNPIYPENIVRVLSSDNLQAINDYIESKQSATTFGSIPERRGSGETITSELIYYWMVAFQIPFECERWHLNRLFALVRVCNVKNAPAKKMSSSEIAARNRELNAQRRAKLNTKG